MLRFLLDAGGQLRLFGGLLRLLQRLMGLDRPYRFEIGTAQRRETETQRLCKTVHSLVLQGKFTNIDNAASAKLFAVGIEHLHIRLALRIRHANAVILNGVGGKVAHRNDLIAFFVDTAERHHRIGMIVMGNPLEPLPGIVHLPHRRILQVKMIELAHIFFELTMGLILQQQPIQFLIVFPFNKLAEFLSHKQQLFPGMGHHKAQETAHTCKLLPVIPRHLIDQRTFSVNHFIVGDGKDKILTEGIE